MRSPHGSDAGVRPGVRGGDDAGATSWLRENVIDVAPLWVEFVRSAMAHVGTAGRPAYAGGPGATGGLGPEAPRRRTAGPATGATPTAPSRHIDAVLALDAGSWPGDGSRFSPVPAPHAPGAEWPPDQWD